MIVQWQQPECTNQGYSGGTSQLDQPQMTATTQQGVSYTTTYPEPVQSTQAQIRDFSQNQYMQQFAFKQDIQNSGNQGILESYLVPQASQDPKSSEIQK